MAMNFFWVVDFSMDKGGKVHPVVIGGRAFSTEIAAQKYIDDSNLSQKAEIFPLPTSNQHRATSMIKAQLIRRFKSVSQGMTKAIHKVRLEEA